MVHTISVYQKRGFSEKAVNPEVEYVNFVICLHWQCTGFYIMPYFIAVYKQLL